MELHDIPKRDPALSLGVTRFEIILADQGQKNLALLTPPLDSVLSLVDIERSLFSLKQDVADRLLFREALEERLTTLLSKESRFRTSRTYLNRLANTHLALGELGEVVSTLERADSLEGADKFISSKRADAKIAAGDPVGGLADLSELSSSRETNAALKIAWHEVCRGDISAASAWVEKSVELNPDGYSERMFQGAIELVKGNYHSAIAYLRIALGARPTSSSAHSNMGMAYLGIGRFDKALQSFRRAVVLNPLNKSALISLCDVASLLARDNEVVGYLKYYVEFEQRESDVWGRVARALLGSGDVDECITALKRQAALDSTMSVWNNLGVAYAIKGNAEASVRSFQQAIQLADDQDEMGGLIVARNTVQTLMSMGLNDMAISVAEDIISRDQNGLLLRDKRLGDVYLFYADALVKGGKGSEAVSLMESIIKDRRSSDDLIGSAVSGLVGHFSLNRDSDSYLSDFIDEHLSLVGKVSDRYRLRVANNFAFGLAELGRLDDATKIVASTSHELHQDAYLTATLGLINFKRGRSERGEKLYREAISLARTRADKARIRQKMNIEIAKSLRGSKAKTRRVLERVVSEKLGEPSLAKQARRIISEL